MREKIGEMRKTTMRRLENTPLGHLLERLEVHRVNEVWLAGAANPDHYVDVTDHFDIRIKALRKHKSQIGGARIAGLRKRLRDRLREVAKDQEFELGEAFGRIVWG